MTTTLTVQDKASAMKMTSRSRCCKFLVVVSLPLSVATVVGFGHIAQAQIIPDATLGTEGSVVTPLNEQADRIDGGATRGSNLFHSFREFNIGEGRGAYFANPAAIENIFSRVTGSNPSHLLGTLGVLGDANLFFLNPNGIIFGKNARLDIRGSLVTSTANSLLFPDGNQFSATNPQAPPLLKVDAPIPIGLQFEGEETGAIINAGDLEVGGNLTLVGGTVASTGQLSASEGEVGVSTVSGVEADGNLAAVELGKTGQISGQEIQPLAGGSGQTENSALSWSELATDGGDETGLTVNGEGKVELAESGTNVSVGDIAVGQLSAQGAKLSATENLTLVESQLGTVGDLRLLAQDTVRVRDSIENPFIAAAGGELLVQGNQGVDIFALNHPDSGLFSGGDMVLRSANPVGGDAHYWSGGSFRIEQLDGSLGNLSSLYDPIIRSQGDVSFNIYRGTSLHILAGGSVDIGTAWIIEPETGAAGDDFIQETVQLSDGTEIFINGSVQPTLDIRAGMTAAAVGSPDITGFDAFHIDFFADSTFSFLEPPPDVTTPATSADITIGDVFIDAPNGLVYLTNQYQSNPSLTGGNITINGAGSFSREGLLGNGIDARGVGGDGGDVILDSRTGITLTGSFIDSSSEVGNSGEITLIANEAISLTNGAFVNSSTLGEGSGGNLTIETGQLIVQDGAKVNASTFSSGDGGRLTVNASESVQLIGGDGQFPTGLFTETRGTGNAGDLTLTTGQLIVQEDGAQISAGIFSFGDGGRLTVNASESVQLIGGDGQFPTGLFTQTQGAGKAGDLTLTTGQLTVRDGAVASASTWGEGAGGNLVVKTSESVQLTGTTADGRFSSGLYTSTGGTGDAGDLTLTTGQLIVQEEAQVNAITVSSGDGGNLTISTPTLLVEDGAQVNASTLGEGAGGSLTVKASDSVQLIAGNLFAQTQGAGKAGDLTLTTGQLTVRDGARVQANTFSSGKGGSLTVKASDSVQLIAGNLSTGSEGKGKAGDLTLTTGQLLVRDGAQVTAGTLGQGVGGSLVVNASDSVQLIGTAVDPRFPSSLSVATRGAGKAGDLRLTTGQLLVRDGAQITAGTFGQGVGGSLVVNASDSVQLIGTSADGQLFSGLYTSTEGTGDAGDLTLTTGQLTVRERAAVSAGTRPNSEGAGGNLTVNASESVQLIGPTADGQFPGGLFTSTGGTGNAGDLMLTTGQLTVRDGAQVNAITVSSGDGGNLTISTPTLLVEDGAQVNASTFGEGDARKISITADTLTATGGSTVQTNTASIGKAGDITLNIRDSLNLTASAIEASTALGSKGNGGNIFIDPRTVIIRDGARVAVNSQGEGIGGNIEMSSGSLTLDNGAEILERCPSKITVEEFKFTDNKVFSEEELIEVVTDEFKNQKTFSCTELLRVALAVTKFYADKGYRTSSAIVVLPKDLTPDAEGKVKIKVIEGKLEEEPKVTALKVIEDESEEEPKVIALDGGRLNNYVRSRLRVEPEEPLNVDDLQEALQLLQLDPLIERISARLSAGSDTGKSILEVQYSGAPTFNPQLFLDNGRSPSVGSFERGVVLRKANLLGLGDGISLGYTNSDGSDRLDLSYELPFNSSNGTLRFTYLQSENDVIEPPFNELDIESESRYYELSLRQPIIRSVKERTFQELALGLTGFWRESESFLSDEPFRFSLGADEDGSTRIFALRFFQDWTLQNSREVIALRSEFSWGLDAFNSTVNQQISGVEEIADSRFFAWRGQAQWARLLAEDSLLLVRGNVQFAEALLSSEQFSVGGLGSVRGYRQDQILTDNGLFVSAEVQLPIFQIAEGEGVFKLIPFFDYGKGWNSSDRSNPDPNNLASMGIGLQWQQGDNFTARLDWGIPLIDVDSRDRTWQENGILFTVQWNPSF